ncbi:MAG: sulfotransferase [Candidatus Cloacimonetes bacterium]|nr:sulfotransferase [Candidatus Cloacimonadota bacterium]
MTKKKKLSDFYKKRIGKYTKSKEEEDFLLNTNKILQDMEKEWYKDYDIKYPFIFVFGLPRSGTTLLSQFIAHSFKISYINNIMARFWLAPIHGIRLSKNILGNEKTTTYNSDYARTHELSDIHEFGYFWRHWLLKNKISGITNIEDIEKKIEWQQLKIVLANIQNEFKNPMIFKNIFGSYHMEKLISLLEKVIFVYIERDELDVALSILKARKKYYKDLNTWWSYMPPEYPLLKNFPCEKQIAGQIYYLKKFYNKKVNTNPEHIVCVTYKELCNEPSNVAKKIQKKSVDLFNYELILKDNILGNFTFRTYKNNQKQKCKFKKMMKEFKYE